MCYLLGEGVEKNPVEAVKYFRQGADGGFPTAEYVLGRAYSEGEGVAKDETLAVAWYRPARRMAA